MPGEKHGQEVSVLGRLCSIEALVIIMGLVSVGYGIATADWTKVLMGALVLLGSLLLLVFGWRWSRCTFVKKEKRKL